MGRKRVEGSAVPTCPRGHAGSDVVRAGTYGQGTAQRQMWWCRPVDETPKHRFAERLPRGWLTDGGHSCAECETHVEVFEGPQHARQYEFASRLIAQALVSVGTGASYRASAQTARRAAGETKKWDYEELIKAGKRTKAGKHTPNGTLGGDWVAAFGPVVTAPHFADEVWPEVVALDEVPFGTTIPRPGWKRREKLRAMWVIWGAYSHSVRGQRGERGELFRLGCSGSLNAVAAAQWLTSIPGRPKYVICDGTKLWPKAVALAWPQVVDPETGEILAETPEMIPCRWHLRRSLLERLRSDSVLPPRNAGQWSSPGKNPHPDDRPPGMAQSATGLRPLRARAQSPAWYEQNRVALREYDDPENHPVYVAAGKAFRSAADWDYMVEIASKWQATHTSTWLVRERWIREELATRDPAMPKTTGGLEAALAKVRTLVRDRAKVLTNQVRTQRMLDLVTLHLRHEDQPDAYAAAIRDHLEAHNGAGPAQRTGVTGGPHMH